MHGVKSTTKKHPEHAVWWTKECNDAVTRRRAAQKNYLGKCSLENWALFRKAQSEAKKIIQKTKNGATVRHVDTGAGSSCSPSQAENSEC